MIQVIVLKNFIWTNTMKCTVFLVKAYSHNWSIVPRIDPSAAAGQTLPKFADAHDGTALQPAATLPTMFDADHTAAVLLHASGGPTNHLPARLITCIENLQFVEVYELLQEAWLPGTTADTTTQAITLRVPCRSTPVSDI